MFETRLSEARIRENVASGAWTGRRLRDSVLAHAARYPDRTAVVDRTGTYTYAEVVRLSELVALGLAALGVRHKDVVAVQLPNRREFVPAFLGIERAGAVVNPLTTILRERELRQMLGLGRARVMVVPDRFRGHEHAATARALAKELPDLEQVVVVGGGHVPGTLRWEDLLELGERRAREAERPSPHLPLGTDVCEVAFTSGTTGGPKGVMHTHNSAVCAVLSTVRRQGLGPGDVFHVVSPVGHNAGYFYGVRVALEAGGLIVMQEAWDPEEMIDLVRSRRCTYGLGSPTHLVDLLSARSCTPEALASLRVYICSGADVPRHLARAALEVIPQALCRVFGMTEIGHTTSTDAASPREKLIETDGSPQPEMRVRVLDDFGRELTVGQEGHVQVSGPFVFAGYVQGRQFTERHFTGEWFHTGDLGRLDADGYLSLTGRAKDIIVRGAEKVPVREIEEVLGGHPRVAEVALVGLPDERLGERAVACVRLRDREPLTLNDLTGFLAERRVTRQFWPEDVAVFESFPKTPAGKVQKPILRRMLKVDGGQPAAQAED